MYKITKQFHFSASHILEGLPPGHKCGRLHGHNYIVEIELQAEQLDETGFVVDYGDLSIFKTFIDNEVDHRHLNDVFPTQTSAENIAKRFYDWLANYFPQVTAVRISETPKTWAEYRP